MKMVKLLESLNCWGTDDFPNVLKSEILGLDENILPLGDAVTAGTFINNSDIGITILSLCENKDNIKSKIGVMFVETQWGYCCGDDEPMENNAYCEIELRISKLTANATFMVL